MSPKLNNDRPPSPGPGNWVWHASQWLAIRLGETSRDAVARFDAIARNAEQVRRNDAEIARLKQQLSSQPPVVPAADANVAKLKEMGDDLKQLKAEANGEKPKRNGFAGKLRFGGGFRPFGSKHTQKGDN